MKWKVFRDKQRPNRVAEGALWGRREATLDGQTVEQAQSVKRARVGVRFENITNHLEKCVIGFKCKAKTQGPDTG